MKLSGINTLLVAVGFFMASCGNGDAGKTGTDDKTGTADKQSQGYLLRNINLIDGNGGQPQIGVDILVVNDTIAKIGKSLEARDAKILDYTGLTVMPALTSGHTHIGNLKDTTTIAANYTRDNIFAQLEKYASYGVLNVLAMGTDRALLFENGLYDSLKSGLLPGSRMYSAGRGFGAVGGMPPKDFAMDNVFRPATAAQAIVQVDSLALLKPSIIKMWVDDGGGKVPKLEPAITAAIISQGKKHGIPASAHVYYQADAKRLIRDGLKLIGHSIRDTIVDDELLQLMKSNNVVYIPTLTLDEYAYIYAGKPEWMDDEFFKRSLEPHVYEKLSSEKYQQSVRNAADYPKKQKAYETAIINLGKIFKAGIMVVMGTDSGANPTRPQGFSEHRELELMVKAGLSPLEAITAATKNGSVLLGTDAVSGTLETGKRADMIVLASNPAENIRHTRTIKFVMKNGKIVYEAK